MYTILKNSISSVNNNFSCISNNCHRNTENTTAVQRFHLECVSRYHEHPQLLLTVCLCMPLTKRPGELDRLAYGQFSKHSEL